MPTRSWVMTQSWHDLLFAHWRVPVSQLAPKIPSGLTLDLFDGEAWVGVVPFRMSNVGPRGVPALPGLSAFPELNVRTYVRAGDTPGVFFFSLDAASLMAVVTARMLFHLPYHWARMRVVTRGAAVSYESRRRSESAGPGRFVARYGPDGDVFAPRSGTLEHFLTERYCLFTIARRSILMVDIHHPPWPLQVAHATLDENTMLDAAGIAMSGPPIALHFAKRQDVVAWAPRAIATPATAIPRDLR